MFPNLGQTSAALTSYDRALALLREASRAQPESASIIHDLIVVSQRRADLLGITLNRTREAIEETSNIRQRILAELSRHPDDPVLLGDLSVTYGRLIILKNAAADTSGAEAECRGYLELAERMLRARPDDPGVRRGALIACTRMAEFREMRGDRDSAVVFYRRALGFARDAVAASPYNTDAARDLSIVYGTYGLFLANGGDIDPALAVSDSSMAILEDLAAKDPDNVLLQSDVAEAGHDIGDVLMKARRFQSAERQFSAVVRSLRSHRRRRHGERGEPDLHGPLQSPRGRGVPGVVGPSRFRSRALALAIPCPDLAGKEPGDLPGAGRGRSAVGRGNGRPPGAGPPDRGAAERRGEPDAVGPHGPSWRVPAH